MMSAQKRKFDATEFGSSGSKIPEIPEAMGIVPIDPDYKPYSIRIWIVKDKKT